MRSLLTKRALNFKRDKKAWVCSTILPCLFALIGFIIYKFLSPERNMVLLDLTLADYNPNVLGEMKNPIPYNNASTFLCNPGYCIDFNEKSSCGVKNELLWVTK